MNLNNHGKSHTMNVKIATFGVILKNPKYEKDQITSEFTEKGFEKKYFKMGMMKAYRKDGSEIPNKIKISEYSDDYQLLGNLFSIAFTGNDILLHHQFGQNTLEITYKLEQYADELKSILNIMLNFVQIGLTGFELILVLRATGSKNTEEGFKKWEHELARSGNFVFRKLDSDKIEYPREINQRCTSKIVSVRDDEYIIELRFVSDDWHLLLDDFKNAEKIGEKIILEIENEK